MYMTEWFMCLFTRTLPWATMLRVWDMFLSEGVKVIFRVALFILKVTLGSSEKLKDCQGLVETLERLRTIPQHYLRDEILIREVSELGITDAAIDREDVPSEEEDVEGRAEPPQPHRPPPARSPGCLRVRPPAAAP
ncbi:TBC1 domain family member 10A-like [Hypanus sabinus]|uniref:TBC1 domain family member 10A-like n=1 Tax=Hypanus sabinus TaxID=79690 RepID=UPI0028C50048|nr:TBC1 domain family member 10A-like [Hypanus sabinus]